jgi:hypothetical protein
MLYDGARYVPTETPAQQAIHAEIGNILAEAQWVVVMDEEWCARYAGERDGGADETTNSTRGYDAVIARTVYCNPWYVSRHVAATRDRAGEAQAGDNSSNTDYNYALFLHALSLAHTLLINLRYELWYRLLHIVSIPPGPLHPLADSRGGRDGEGWEFGLFAGLVRGMWDQIPTEPRIPTSPEEATEIDPICSWRERDWGNEDTDGVDTERNVSIKWRTQSIDSLI